MVFTLKIREAVRFSVKVHEIDQKQKRKNKDVAYITHPLTVGLILAKAGADEDTIIAGILHDTIEDSIPEKKVTREMLINRFGEKVTTLVQSVSEPAGYSWEETKEEMLGRINTYSHALLLIKSADVISNIKELMDDYREFGEEVFMNFDRPKNIKNNYSIRTIHALLEPWSDNPLAEDLRDTEEEIKKLFCLE